MKDSAVSDAQQSPYEFDFKNTQKPPRDHRLGIKFQCVVVLLLLVVELTTIWLRPAYLDLLARKEAAEIEVTKRIRSVSRDEFYQLMISPTELEHLARYTEAVASGCIAASLLCYIPFLLSIFLSTSRENRQFRYLSLLATGVPLAIGLYYEDLLGDSVSLPLLYRMAYQYMIIALISHVFFLNASCISGNQKKPLAYLSAVPVTFLVVAMIQGILENVSAMYLFAAVATAAFVACSYRYVRLCFGQNGINDPRTHTMPAFETPNNVASI